MPVKEAFSNGHSNRVIVLGLLKCEGWPVEVVLIMSQVGGEPVDL